MPRFLWLTFKHMKNILRAQLLRGLVRLFLCSISRENLNLNLSLINIVSSRSWYIFTTMLLPFLKLKSHIPSKKRKKKEKGKKKKKKWWSHRTRNPSVLLWRLNLQGSSRDYGRSSWGMYEEFKSSRVAWGHISKLTVVNCFYWGRDTLVVVFHLECSLLIFQLFTKSSCSYV